MPCDDVDFGLGRLAFFDGDDAVVADLLHRLGQLLADLGVVVGAMVATSVISFLSFASIFSASFLSSSTTASTRLLDAAGEGHRVGAGGDRLEAFAEDGLGEDGGGGGAVAGDVAGLAGGFLDELGAHVLVRVVELDVLGDGDAVLGDGRAAPALVEDGVAAARPERAADGPGELADAGEQLLPGVVGDRRVAWLPFRLSPNGES